ncbi:MAG: hypothetical protein A3K19_23220 [Lentisphaerae bacterium RIFOXYB12_FULL_65_16]|nr:MAG: hypothetical protein A3K18_30830 [Lentisphaerae bacterium RIFOXYA12_64_32]OGV90280.1 MAG: hypothetical protein A3K19_23220 [Lentisphaerae bacterium RIFOXYB12_FULL_65_16]
MATGILGVSWINGNVRAAVLRRGQVTHEWTYSGKVDGPAFPAEVMAQAVQETGFRGREVRFTLWAPRAMHLLVGVPPAKGILLDRFLERKADEFKAFPDKAVWSYRRTMSCRQQGDTALLSLAPESYYLGIVAACRQGNHVCTRIVFPVSLLTQFLPQMQHSPGAAVMLAAEMEGVTALVIGCNDGQLLFARAVASHWEDDADFLAQEINRSILYAKQQFAAAVEQVHWMGADPAVAKLQALLKCPIAVGPPLAPFFWVSEVLRQPVKQEENLVPATVHTERRQRLFATVAAAALGIFLLGVVAMCAVTEGLLRQARRNLEFTQVRYQKETQFRRQMERLAALQESLKAFSDTAMHPVPAWFAGWLGEVLPDEVVLSRVEVRREKGAWHFQVDGAAANGEPITRRMLADVQARLRTPPCNAAIIDPETETEAVPAGTVRLKPVQTTRAFCIEGILR